MPQYKIYTSKEIHDDYVAHQGSPSGPFVSYDHVAALGDGIWCELLGTFLDKVAETSGNAALPQSLKDKMVSDFHKIIGARRARMIEGFAERPKVLSVQRLHDAKQRKVLLSAKLDDGRIIVTDVKERPSERDVIDAIDAEIDKLMETTNKQEE